MKVTGLILAGGKSTRMGTDKGFLDLNGKSFVAHIVGKLKEVNCDKIVISSNDKKYENFQLPIISDLIPDIGAIGGIYSVIKQTPSDYFLVLSCDSPLVSIAVLEALIEKSKATQKAVICQVGKQLYPLVGCYPISVLKEVECQIKHKQYSLMNFVAKIQAETLTLTTKSSTFLLNCNTPEDYKKLQYESINN